MQMVIGEGVRRGTVKPCFMRIEENHPCEIGQPATAKANYPSSFVTTHHGRHHPSFLLQSVRLVCYRYGVLRTWKPCLFLRLFPSSPRFLPSPLRALPLPAFSRLFPPPSASSRPPVSSRVWKCRPKSRHRSSIFSSPLSSPLLNMIGLRTLRSTKCCSTTAGSPSHHLRTLVAIKVSAACSGFCLGILTC